jgi:hypothetical protein
VKAFLLTGFATLICLVAPAQTFRTNSIAPTNKPPLFPPSPAITNAPRLTKSATNPPPGVYTTEPYHSIVVIPGPFPDDRMIAGAHGSNQPATQPSIPTLRPELRFIPYPKPKTKD